MSLQHCLSHQSRMPAGERVYGREGWILRLQKVPWLFFLWLNLIDPRNYWGNAGWVQSLHEAKSKYIVFTRLKHEVQRHGTFSALGTQCRETEPFSSPLSLETWRILETTVLLGSVKALSH